MKLTIVANKVDGSHQQALLKAAQKAGLKASIENIKSADIPKNLNKKLGDAIIWRSSDLDVRSERVAISGYLKGKFVVSESVFTYPSIRFKYFQQQRLASEKSTAKWSIPTFRFSSRVKLIKAIEQETLKLPIIAKPNASAWGKGIVLLKSITECNEIEKIKDFVFQDFIPNDGDWRVIVVGGYPLGAMKRMAANGGYLNNVSQGADSMRETDPSTLKQLYKMATKVASMFDLRFCGVDIIKDKKTGEYLVLEVNTAPQWASDKGFQAATGTDVPAELVNYIIEKANPEKQKIVDKIESYYKNHIDVFPDEAFHFASRLSLWSNDEWSKQLLNQRQRDYIGTNQVEIRKTIKQILNSHSTGQQVVNQNKSYRNESFSKYPDLSTYNRILFKVIFAETIYGLDIRSVVQEFISDKKFMDLFRQLINDHDSIRLLSTHAINYFYLLKFYFKDSLNKSSSVLVDPYELLNLLSGYKKLEQDGVIDKATSVKLKIYLLTHAIIGHSRFYSRRVKGRSYKRLCQEIEKLISDNYFKVTLDNKFEFLVCAALCDYDDSQLAPMIRREATQSLSWAGNFLIDTVNSNSQEPTRHCLRTSEHRNVLFLMSQKRFQHLVTEDESRHPLKKRLIGRLARISIPDKGINRLVARVDSGATRSSIAASEIYESRDGLHYKLMHKDHYLYSGHEFVTKDYEIIDIKTTANKRDRRYAVALGVIIDGRRESAIFTLADREHMLYPVLLGRNFLTGKYRVDTDRQFVHVIKVPRKHGKLGKGERR